MSNPFPKTSFHANLFETTERENPKNVIEPNSTKAMPVSESYSVHPINQRFQLIGKYDHIFLNDQIKKSKRFQNLKPEVHFQFLVHYGKYDHLKKFAIEQLMGNVNKQLKILQKVYQNCQLSEEPNESIAHNVYSWFMDDYNERRRLEDFVWLDVLQRTSEDSLNFFKYQQDLKQLKKCLKLIFEALLSKIDNKKLDVYEDLVKPFNEAEKLLTMSQRLEKELEENIRRLKELELKDSVFAHIKRDSIDEMTRSCLLSKILNRHIWGPIEVRYQLTWQKSQVEQYQHRLTTMEASLLSNIQKYEMKRSIESRVNTNCMDFYYNEIESLKKRIGEMQEKFEIEYEKAVNRIAYKKSQNEKLQDQMKFLRKEIERFHKEIELMRIQEEREAVVKESKRLERETLALKKKQRKSKKRNKTSKASKAHKSIKKDK
ncbi:uncharacterized protein LOC142222126 [Haematobia irritans]|uniref:uncharacterized protein LOC142222126 n=1 Tax=Haematobia irritans TaxID=7368 RepID=UPI003F509D2B